MCSIRDAAHVIRPFANKRNIFTRATNGQFGQSPWHTARVFPRNLDHNARASSTVFSAKPHSMSIRIHNAISTRSRRQSRKKRILYVGIRYWAFWFTHFFSMHT